MRRDQLEQAIRTACQIIGRPEVIVVGSQSILGTFREDELPADATMSVEIDILPTADGNAEIKRLADLIEGAAGELSPFEELHGFSIDGGWCLDKEDLCVAKLCAFREKDQNFVDALIKNTSAQLTARLLVRLATAALEAA